MSETTGPLNSAEGAPAAHEVQPGNRFFTAFLIVSVIALATLVLLLVRQNRELKAEVGALRTAAIARASLRPGETVTPLSLIAPDGAISTLDFPPSGPPTLFFMIGQNCPHCEKTIPIWEQILRDVVPASKPARLRIVGVVADIPDSEPIRPASPLIPSFRVKGAPKTWLLKVNATPAAVLLDHAGVVQRLWLGELTPEEADQMRLAIVEALGPR